MKLGEKRKIKEENKEWIVRRRDVEEYLIARYERSGSYYYDIRIERTDGGELKKLIIDTSTERIELPPIAFKVFGLLVGQGILKEEELIRK